MLNQPIYPACVVLVCWLLSVTGHHMDVVKDDEGAINRTKEWTVKEKKRIAKPHLDLYVQDEGILLMTEVYQTPLDVTLNILMNNVTIDVTRYENNTCYNIHGKCSSTICSCIVENNIFTSTYHLTFRKKYMTLGLEYRFIHEMDGAIVKVCLFKTFDGANFSRPYTNFVTLHTFAADRNELNIPSRNIINNMNKLGKPPYETILVFAITCIICFIIYKVYRSTPNCKTDDKLALHEEQIKNKEPTNCSTNRHKRNEMTNVLDKSPSGQLMLPEKDSSSEDDARDIESIQSGILSNFENDTTTGADSSINTNIKYESCEWMTNVRDRTPSGQLMLHEKDSSSEDDARDIESLHSDILSNVENDTTTGADTSINTNIKYESCEWIRNVQDKSSSRLFWWPSESDVRYIERFNSGAETAKNINIEYEARKRENQQKEQKIDNGKKVKKKRKTGSSALSLLNRDELPNNSITGSDMVDLDLLYYMDVALPANTSKIRNTDLEKIDAFGEITADNYAAVPVSAKNTFFGIDVYKIVQVVSRFPVIGAVISGAVSGIIDNFTRRTPE